MALIILLAVGALSLAACTSPDSVETPTTSTAPPTTTTTLPGATTGLKPPPLSVVPGPGATVDRFVSAVTGTTDPDATVEIAGEDVPVNDLGHFRWDGLRSRPGLNELVVLATAPDGSTRRAAFPYRFEPPEGWVVFVGDSLTVGMTPLAEDRFEGSRINARTGRGFAEGVSELIDMVDRPDGPQLLVVNLGANGGATPERFDTIMEVAALVPRVLFVNLRIDRGWETDTNTVIEDGVDRYPNAFLVDWNAAASGNEDSYLRGDRVHLTPAGNEALMTLIEAVAFG